MANISRKERVKRAVASQEAGVEVGKLGREAKTGEAFTDKIKKHQGKK